MNEFDEEFERGRTRDIFLRLNGLALLVPLALLTVTYLYFHLQGIELTRAQWKTFALLAWLGTLALLVREALSRVPFRSARKRSRAPAGAARLSSWEGRATRKLIRELIRAMLFIPTSVFALVALYAQARGVLMTPAAWERVALLILIGTFCALLHLSLKGRKSRLMYKAQS